MTTRFEIRTAAGALCHGTADEAQARELYAKLAAVQAVALYRVELLRESPAHAADRERLRQAFTAPAAAVG